MTLRWLRPDRVFDGGRLLDGAAIGVSGDRIETVGVAPEGSPITRVEGIVTPGFTDLQVNGGGGVLFNNDPSRDALVR